VRTSGHNRFFPLLNIRPLILKRNVELHRAQQSLGKGEGNNSETFQ